MSRYNVSRTAAAALRKLGLAAAAAGDAVLVGRVDRALAGELHWVDLLGELGELADDIDLDDYSITN